MTIDQFNETRFGAGDKVIYDWKEYDIYSVDFEEALIGINENIPGSDEDDISWKRCENCELVKNEPVDKNQLSIYKNRH
jgi:hypothetical protein